MRAFVRCAPPSLAAVLLVVLLCRPLGLSAAQCNAAEPLLTSLYSAADCQWAEFDFTPLAAVDLYGGDQYGAMSVFRMCGAVSDAACSAASGGDGQLCRWGTNASSTPACSPVDVELTTGATYNFSYIDASLPYTGGVLVTIYPDVAAPVMCNGAPFVTIVQLLCDPHAPAVPQDQLSALIAAVNTSSSCPCSITIDITTSLACATPPANSSSSSSSSTGVYRRDSSSSSTGVSSSASASFSSTSSPATASSTPAFQCLANPFGLNLSSLTVELLWQSPHNSQHWFVNLCGGIDDFYCNLLAPGTSVCGYQTCNPWSSRRRISYASVPTASTTNRWRVSDGVNATNGIEYLQRNGQLTADTQQQTVVRLVCDPSATSAYIDRVDVTTNTATVVIRTNLTCRLVVTDSTYLCPSGCCGMGYDFTALDYDIYGYTPAYAVWGIRMCGSLTSPSCPDMFICQNAACGGTLQGAYGFGNAMSAWQPSTQLWSFINGRDYSGGVQLQTVNGVDCPTPGAGSTAVTVHFMCDPTALHPNDYNIVQSGACEWTLTLRTAIVCAAPSFGSSAVVLSQPLPSPPTVPGCQFEGYDMSPLSAYDIKRDYGYYLFVSRVCGQVDDRAALLDSQVYNGSVVQVGTYCNTLGSEFLVSSWNPYMAVSSLIPTGGVQVNILSGSPAYCAGPRGLKWFFLCDPTARYAYLSNIVEEFGVNKCHYDLTIMTDIVCGPPTLAVANSSGQLNGSWSSTGQTRLFNGTDNGAGRVGGQAWTGVVAACVFALLSSVLQWQI